MKVFRGVCFIALVIGLSSCQSAKKKIVGLSENDNSIVWRQLTFVGENKAPQYVEEQNKILFLSSYRRNHIQGQIYQLDLNLEKEKRLTYQHVGVEDFELYEGQSVLIASSMDEEEENPKFLALATSEYAIEAFSRMPASFMGEPVLNKDSHLEIYAFDLGTSSLTRLTQSPGYDSEMTYNKKSKEVFFVSKKQNKFGINKWELKTKENKVIYTSTSKIVRPDFNNLSEELVWVEMNPEQTLFEIKVRGKNGVIKSVYNSQEKIHSATWSGEMNQGLFLAVERRLGKVDLVYLSKNYQCVENVTESSGSDIFPSYDYKKQNLYFSSNKTGTFQIYSMKFAPQECNNFQTTGLK